MIPAVAQLEALKWGEEEAWALAFRHLWPVALRAGLHPELRLTPEEAEEVASEALASLVSRIDNISTFDELSALAATIAYRRAVSFARRKYAAKRQPATESSPAYGNGSDPDEVGFAPGENGPTEAELAELALVLRDAMATLDEGIRLLVYEKTVMGKSYEELSAKYQVPLGTICARVARGLKKVRQRLHESPALMKELREYLR